MGQRGRSLLRQQISRGTVNAGVEEFEEIESFYKLTKENGFLAILLGTLITIVFRVRS
jgi:hypothetical protein